jgi:hypothetical protein
MAVHAGHLDIQIGLTQVGAPACDPVILGDMALLALHVGSGDGHVPVELNVTGVRRGKSEVAALYRIAATGLGMAGKTV